MNIVILCGRLSSAPRRTELPSGDTRWAFELTTPSGDAGGASAGPAAASSVPVVWNGEPSPGERCVGDAHQWTVGTELAVTGMVRRRFYRAGGVTQSRTEVVAFSMVELTRRRSAEAALRRAIRAMGGPTDAALRSAMGMLNQA